MTDRWGRGGTNVDRIILRRRAICDHLRGDGLCHARIAHHRRPGKPQCPKTPLRKRLLTSMMRQPAATLTGCHWLHVVCPACQQLGDTDLRKIGTAERFAGHYVRAMSCRRGSPHPPFGRSPARRSYPGKPRRCAIPIGCRGHSLDQADNERSPYGRTILTTPLIPFPLCRTSGV